MADGFDVLAAQRGNCPEAMRDSLLALGGAVAGDGKTRTERLVGPGRLSREAYSEYGAGKPGAASDSTCDRALGSRR